MVNSQLVSFRFSEQHDYPTLTAPAYRGQGTRKNEAPDRCCVFDRCPFHPGKLTSVVVYSVHFPWSTMSRHDPQWKDHERPSFVLGPIRHHRSSLRVALGPPFVERPGKSGRPVEHVNKSKQCRMMLNSDERFQLT